MASAPSDPWPIAVPAPGDVWPSGQEVRPGTAAAADAVAKWRSDTIAVNGALEQAVEALRNGSSETMVLFGISAGIYRIASQPTMSSDDPDVILAAARQQGKITVVPVIIGIIGMIQIIRGLRSRNS